MFTLSSTFGVKNLPTLKDRSAGILLHVSSLPTSYPIGDIGPAAYAFVDFLAAGGQRWWQMLPLSPAGLGHSPYTSSSAFAGNPLLISPDLLIREGWITSRDARCPSTRPEVVNFDAAYDVKAKCLRKAFDTFRSHKKTSVRRAFETFRHAQRAWLRDFALFSALQTAFGAEWTRWPEEYRSRKPAALSRIAQELAPRVQYHEFVQWLFDRQWRDLRRYAALRGIGIIGDIPIFVAMDSAEVWAHPNIFHLKADGTPSVVAGVPPDFFSKTGQRWGNPLYRWDSLRKTGYGWWLDRFRRTLDYFDAVRLDHFIGFSRYYAIPAKAPTAKNGRYLSGPGHHFFQAVLRALGEVPFIAEDLGVTTPSVEALRDEFHLPGMKILQYAFWTKDGSSPFQPHNYTRPFVVYTGTHDNDTTRGWFEKIPAGEKAHALRYLDTTRRDVVQAMIRAAFMSVAHLAIIPMQDHLSLGSEARMNFPGEAEGNWKWRLLPKAASSPLAKSIRRLTETSGRLLSK